MYEHDDWYTITQKDRDTRLHTNIKKYVFKCEVK